MNFISLPSYPFSFNFLTDCLQSYKYPRDKITRMIKNEEIIRIKKGLYILSPKHGGNAHLPVLANLIYGPSYISFDYALSYWGLIPEKVQVITSVTNKRNKQFNTPVGKFTYSYVNPIIFSIGATLITNENISFFIATKEKALCDKIASIKNIKNINDVSTYLRKDLRLYIENISDLDIALLLAIAARYKKKSIDSFILWYQTTIKRGGNG